MDDASLSKGGITWFGVGCNELYLCCGPTDVWDPRVDCEPTGVFGGVCIRGGRAIHLTHPSPHLQVAPL